MSSTVFANKNPSPAVTRRPPASNENAVNASQNSTNRRSLSVKLRNLFRKDSSSPNRTSSSDRRQPTTMTDRQSSLSPEPNRSSTETPHLRAPAVYWPFGKKKTKPSSTTSTPTASKKKVKSSKKTKQNSNAPMEISSPIYDQENQTFIHGQNFIPRTPELTHDSSGRVQSSSTKGFRDYVLVDQTQQPHQVIVPDADVFTSRTYMSDRSRSPSMNYQHLPNTNTQYRYQYENLTPSTSIAYPDVEVIHTPKSKRTVDDTPSSTYNRVVLEKPPLSPQNPYRSQVVGQPPNITTNPYLGKSTSSSTINTTGVHSIRSPARDTDAPKFHTPSVPFGNTSSKTKKPKRTQSQSRVDRMSTSSSTINKLVEFNPVKPTPLYGSTYGSLPDVEPMFGGSSTSLKPVKPKKDRYPGLSAIVFHHIRSRPVYVDNRPYVTTPPITSSRRPPRFETSTTTLNEHEHDQSWIRSSINSSAAATTTTTSTHQHHDGYIRPMTPQKPIIQSDVSIIRTDTSDFRNRSPTPPPHRPPRYDSPAHSPTYRSSTTVYTRDKQLYIHGGEIRTWSSQDNGLSDGYDNSYKKPQPHVDVVRTHESPIDHHAHLPVPPNNQNYRDEYRYSPRGEELGFKDKQQVKNNSSDHEDVEEEERYEVSYEYQRQHQPYSYEVSKHYDEVQSTNRYSDDHASDKNYANLTSTANSSIITERNNSNYQVPRSYRDTERTQASYDTVASIVNTDRIIHTYSVKRSDSYDGLGIFISADAATRLNHIIREVEPGSPGYHAGLRANDRIISINNVNVENVDFENVLILIKQGFQNNNLQLSVIHEQKHI